ncbi:MAG: hypothetical protein OXF48_04810 [Bacteroidetes bacterium]|nr:hypothetical protein [Bacteroidota bacterium]
MQIRTGRWQRLLTGMGMRPPFYLPLLTLTLYFFWRGYDYAISDQDEILPYLMHLLDPSLYRSDWFVNVQTETFGPRTLFVWIAWLPAKLFGPYATILGIYVASWFGTSMALYALGLQLTRERLAATICVILALLLPPKFTLGGNDLVTWILTPSIPAWTFSLWGLLHFVRGQTGRAALLMGIATWIQALVGLQTGLICTLMLLWKHGWSVRRPSMFAGWFTLSALPALGPLIWFQFSRPHPDGLWSYFYILFEFRAPHHYMPSSFPLESVVGFTVLLVLGLAVFSQLPKVHHMLVRRSLIVIGVLCIFSFLCTEILRIDPITRLQLFKLTVLVKVFCVILIANALSRMILKFCRRTLTAFFDHGHYAFGGTLLIAATLLLISPDALGIRPTSVSGSAEQVAVWARDSTEVDAVFAVPPQWAHFRSQGQRAVVVSFKAVPFHQPYMTQWFTRLLDMAPISPPQRGGAPIMSVLDSAYFALPVQEIQRLAEKYNFEYIVRKEAKAPEGFESAYQVGSWNVWRIKPRP